MAEEKSSTPEKDFEDLKSMFDADHKYWKNLYSDHSKAHSAARPKVKPDTTGLTTKEILEELGKYIEAYDETIKGKSTGMNEYRKEMSKGQAREMLQNIASQRRITFDQLIDEIKRQGLEEIFAQYSNSVKQSDVSGLTQVLLDKHVDFTDEKKVKDFTASLKKNNPILKGKSDYIISSNLRTYLAGYMQEYHSYTVPKPAEKKAA